MRPHRPLALAAVVLLLTSACMPLLPTPEDLPQPPWTPIVEFPTSFPPTSAPRPVPKPIYPDDMAEARTFFLLVQVGMAAGDSGMIAECVLYPIEVRVNGQPTMIRSAEEFERSYDGIFHPQFQQVIMAGREEDLVLLPDGVQASSGALWFGQFCLDAGCTQAEFRITEINN